MSTLWHRLVAVVRLAHPLPTLLNAVAAAALSSVAGASPLRAALAAITMLGVHTFIGATNDYLDRVRDSGRAEKPLAAGALPPAAALLLAASGLSVGLFAAAQIAPLTFALAAGGAAVGTLYNVWLKRTALSWLPFAIGLSLIPPFAWSTVTTVLPAGIATLSLVALPGGAALALQNSLADHEIDLRSGLRGAAVRLGERQTLLAILLLHLITLTALLLTAPANASTEVLLLAALLLAVGVACSASRSRWARQRGWELSATALAVAALSIVRAASEGVG